MYERGEVLRSYLFTLYQYSIKNFKETQQVFELSSLACDLLSARPQICCSAMDRYFDLKYLLISLVKQQWRSELDKTNSLELSDMSEETKTSSTIQKSTQASIIKSEFDTSITLMRATAIIISNWSDEADVSDSDHSDHATAKSELSDLVRYLIPSYDNDNGEEENKVNNREAGFCFVKHVKRALTVEEVSVYPIIHFFKLFILIFYSYLSCNVHS